MIHCDTLLQNATGIITKCDSHFYTKCDRTLSQNASEFLLQNATVLLQNTTVITKCDDFITKCESYYKMRRLLQIATVHTLIKCVTFLCFVLLKSRLDFCSPNDCNIGCMITESS